jgi:Uma2 family endonuclease
MVSSTVLHGYSFADYLALEEASNTKHEFLNGEIYAMAGGTPEHAALAVATSAALLAQLAGGPCRVYSSDLRVRVLATGLATSPDVTVVCGAMKRDPESADTVTNPRLVVEVTSKGTESEGRGEKLEQYRKVPSLQAVVLVSHREPHIEVWEPAADGTWSSRSFESGQTAEVRALPVRLVVDEIDAAAREPGA